MTTDYVFSVEECKSWKKNLNVNPKTGRKIDPNAEFGVYQMLKRQCEEKDIKKEERLDRKPNNSVYFNNNNNAIRKCQKEKEKEKEEKEKVTPLPKVTHVRIIVIQHSLQGLLQKVMECTMSNCVRDKTSFQKTGSIIKNVSTGFTNVKTLKEFDGFVAETTKILKNKQSQTFFECMFQNCLESLSPFIQRYQHTFNDVRSQMQPILDQGQIKRLDSVSSKIKELAISVARGNLLPSVAASDVFMIPMMASTLLVILQKRINDL